MMHSSLVEGVFRSGLRSGGNFGIMEVNFVIMGCEGEGEIIFGLVLCFIAAVECLLGGAFNWANLEGLELAVGRCDGLVEGK